MGSSSSKNVCRTTLRAFRECNQTPPMPFGPPNRPSGCVETLAHLRAGAKPSLEDLLPIHGGSETAQCHRMKAGDNLGPWKLTSRLGRGGNAEVWNVENGEGRTAAIKVLRSDRQSRDRLARFKDEIKFLQRPDPHPGVLPILDAHLSNADSDPPWLVMPVAKALRTSLGDSPPVSAVVRAIAEIAETLAALAADGIGHRDIKPENLYELEGRFLVGDFGLITYPDKDPMTRSGRRLGPIDFMAPEMRDAADEAAAEPANVYALAKTFWVLAVDRELPLPGTHRVDDAAYSLASNLTGEHLPHLSTFYWNEQHARCLPIESSLVNLQVSCARGLALASQNDQLCPM